MAGPGQTLKSGLTAKPTPELWLGPPMWRVTARPSRQTSGLPPQGSSPYAPFVWFLQFLTYHPLLSRDVIKLLHLSDLANFQTGLASPGRFLAFCWQPLCLPLTLKHPCSIISEAPLCLIGQAHQIEFFLSCQEKITIYSATRSHILISETCCVTHLLLAPRAISTLVTTYLEGSPHTGASSSGPSASRLLLHVGVRLRLLLWQAFPGEKGKPMPALAPIPTAA